MLLIRMTYSNTKRFLKSSIQSFKSYFAGGYQRLPKTPPCNPFSCTTSTSRGIHFNNHSYREQQENTTNHHTKAAATMKDDQTSCCSHDMKKKKKKQQLIKEPNLIMNNIHYDDDEVDDIKNQEINEKHGKDEEEEENIERSSKKCCCLVTRKLKELEMMDQNNMDLVLDIQEVLHYYSRLTCPVYRDIIDKFFVEIYSGTFNITHSCP